MLADSFDVIPPDLVGFGDSENPTVDPDEGYGVADHVPDLRGLVSALDIEEYGFVSHDLGACVGQRIARETIGDLRGLFFFFFFFFDCPYPGIGERWRASEHIGEIWYQSFHQQPWATDLVLDESGDLPSVPRPLSHSLGW